MVEWTLIPGAYTGMMWPNGTYAVGRGNDVVTSAGTVACPPGDRLLYVACSQDGSRVGGQSWLGAGNLEHSGTWRTIGPSYGVNPVIYDPAGTLWVNNGSAGAYGYSYAPPSGYPVTADAMKGPLNGLSERIELTSDLWIGQDWSGAYGGAIVWDRGVHRGLLKGSTTFIRANLDGSRVALAVTTPEGVKLAQTTLEALRALPQVTLSASTPAPTPAPGPASPTPVPHPERTPSPVMNQLYIVQSVRARYPTPLGATHGSFLIECAQAIGCGLLLKDWGTFVRLPNGTGVAQDIMCWPDGTAYDCLVGGEDAATPAWQPLEGPPLDPARYYSVAGLRPTGGILEPSRPTPAPPGPTSPAVPAQPPTPLVCPRSQEVDTLMAEVAFVKSELASALVGIQDVLGRLAALEAAPKAAQARYVGKVGRAFGHSHPISIEVVR